MIRVTLAETAGFCFGVDRAVSLCEEMLDAGERIATLGEIIHNADVVRALSERGCGIVSQAADTPPGVKLVIRSHGVGREIYEDCAAHGIEPVDATCPFVSKIHSLVRDYGAQGYTVLVAGDAAHPEVQGIVGHCVGPVYIFNDTEELSGILRTMLNTQPCIMVAQTTLNLVKYRECAELTKKTCTNLLVFDTICSATRARQQEAEALSRTHDVCVVIGGRNSSNTGKLYEVCAGNARTYRIERADELKAEMFFDAETIGVTAGASTPSHLIEEVLHTMDEMIRDENFVEETATEQEAVPEVAEHSVQKEAEPVREEEFNFEQALEDSMRLVHRGQRVEGIVTSIRPNEIVVDIGTKHTGFIPLDELSDDSAAKPEDIVKVGDKLNLIVIKVQDLEGFVTLSKKRVDSELGLDDLQKGMDEGTVFDAYVTEVVNKGLVAVVKGVRIFIPASQATLRRGEPYDHLARTHQKVKILEVNPERRRAIGSIRAVLDVENGRLREEFWKNIEVGKKYTGKVKSLTAYGAFVDLGAVDGMIHKSELSWSRVAKPADIVSIGQEVEVYVKDFDPEAKKISLGYRDEADNPWNKMHDMTVGSVFEAPVVSMTAFGAFVRVLPGVDGLVHISEMSNEHVKAPGDVVKVGMTIHVRLIGVDFEKKRVSLSMKSEDGELLNPDLKAEKPAPEPEKETETAEEPVAEPAEEVAAEPAEEVAAEPVEEPAAPEEEPAEEGPEE